MGCPEIAFHLANPPSGTGPAPTLEIVFAATANKIRLMKRHSGNTKAQSVLLL